MRFFRLYPREPWPYRASPGLRPPIRARRAVRTISLQPDHLAPLWPPCPTCAKGTSPRPPFVPGAAERACVRGCRNNASGNGHCGLRSSPLLAPSDRQVHLRPAQLGLSFGLFNYARGRRHMAVAIPASTAFFSRRALELLGHGKTDIVKGAQNSGFLHGTWSKGTVPTPQLAHLVRERVGSKAWVMRQTALC
eukprot:scaffold133347_cov92-Phaeocystis_antarctica.AAC.2